MANLPEKNIVTVSKVTSIPSNTNVFINANGEFVQANIDDVVSAGNQFKVFNGNLILAKGTSEGYATDFEGYGNSTQDGEPTPDNPIEINSVGDKGYFDGELLQGMYATADGAFAQNSNIVCSKNPMPCNSGDKVTLTYEVVTNALYIFFYDKDMKFISREALANVSTITATAPTNAKWCHINISNIVNMTPQQAKHICVTINGNYALIVKNGNKNLFDITQLLKSTGWTYTNGFYSGLNSGIHAVFGTNGFNMPKFLENTQYTLSLNAYVSAGNSVIRVYYTDNTYSDLSITATTVTKYKLTTTLGKTISRIVGSYISGSSNTFYIKDMQIEIGTQATDYVPHEEQTTYIPIAEPLRGIGEVKDEIACVDGVYGVVRGSAYKQITSVTKNSSDTNDYLYYQLFNDKKHITTVKCNTLIDKHLNTLIGGNSVDKVGITGRGDNNVIYINVGYYLAENTVSAMNTWLAENPTYVEYELAESVFEPFTDQTPFYRLKTFEGVTHISATDDMEMVVEVPTSRAGGVASIGWSKGNLAQIETQNLSAKIAELQTAMVNM